MTKWLVRQRIWILSAAFVTFSGVVVLGLSNELDFVVRATSQEHSPGFFDAVLSFFSLLGSPAVAGAILLLLLAALFVGGHPALAGRLLAVFIATGLLELVMKLYLPQLALPPREVAHTEYFAYSANITTEEIIGTTYSYPSGHMLRGVIVLGALYWLSSRRLLRAGVLTALLGLALARIYFETHWASDVVGGALLGAAGLLWALGGKTRLKLSEQSAKEPAASVSSLDHEA